MADDDQDGEASSSEPPDGGTEPSADMTAAVAAARAAIEAVKAAEERFERAQERWKATYSLQRDFVRFTSSPRIVIDSKARAVRESVEACCQAAERAAETALRTASGYFKYVTDWSPAKDAAKAAQVAAGACDAVRKRASAHDLAPVTAEEDAAELAARELADTMRKATNAARLVVEAVDASDRVAADAHAEILRKASETLAHGHNSAAEAEHYAVKAEAADREDDLERTCVASDAARAAAKEAEAIVRPLLGAAQEFLRLWEREARLRYRGRPMPLGPLWSYAGAGEDVASVRAISDRVGSVVARADEAAGRARRAAERVTRRWNDRARAEESSRLHAAYGAWTRRSCDEDDSDDDGNNQFADDGGNYPSTNGNSSGGGRGND